MGIWRQLKNFVAPRKKPDGAGEIHAIAEQHLGEQVGLSLGNVSPLPSPSDWDRRKQAMPSGLTDPDYWIRYCDFLQADILSQQYSIIRDALKTLCSDAVGTKPLCINIKPFRENDAEAQDEAIRIEAAIKRPVERALNPSVMRSIAYDFGLYGNLPVFLSFKGKTFVDLQPMAPHGIRMNLDSRLRFDKSQKDCYVQHDVNNWGKRLAAYNYNSMVWASWGPRSFIPYGSGPVSLVAQELEDLRKGRQSIAEARENLSPFVAYLVGVGGVPHDQGELKRFIDSLPHEKRKSGIAVGKGEPVVLNGGNEVSVIAPPSGYYNEMEDVRSAQTSILSAFGIAYALQFDQRLIRDKALELLENRLYAAQSIFLSELEWQLIIPICERIAVRNGLDMSKVYIEVDWAQYETPSRQLQKCLQAGYAYNAGLISRKGYQRINCNYLGLNPDSEQAEIAKEQEAGIYTGGKPAPHDADPSKAGPLQGNVLNSNPQLALVHGPAVSNGKAAGGSQ